MGAGRGVTANVQAILVGVVTFGVSLATAFDIHRLTINDVTSAVMPGWSIAHRGVLDIPDAYWRSNIFLQTVDVHGRHYSDRPLGMILFSIPGQAFTPQPTTWGPSVTTALLAALTFVAVLKLWGWRVAGLLAVSPLLYSVDRTLWPEAVCIPLLLVGLLLIRADRLLWLLLPLTALMTLCRPPFGLLAVLVFAVILWRRREFAWAVAGLAAGVAILYIYSHIVFDRWSLTGAYTTPHTVTWHWLVLGTISPARGLLWWTPWLLFVRPRLRRDKLLLLIAVAYVVGSWLTYDAWGGTGFLGYRYPVPLVVLGAAHVRRPTTQVWSVLFDLAIAWSATLAIVAETLVFTLSPLRETWKSGLPLAETFAVFACVLVLIFYYRIRLEPELARRRQAREPVGAAT